jgi:hypothetical protein
MGKFVAWKIIPELIIIKSHLKELSKTSRCTHVLLAIFITPSTFNFSEMEYKNWGLLQLHEPTLVAFWISDVESFAT